MTDDTKSKAYLFYAEWGPQRSSPRPQRLAAAFPSVSEQERQNWIADFEAVNKELWQAAEQGGPRTGSFDAFKRHMRRLFPFMNEDALRFAWTVVGYYTAHEGY
ncbi:MAG: hypothetical protein R3C44_21570 [Chloroflexota bacterium]